MEAIVNELLALAAKVDGGMVSRAAALSRIQVLLQAPTGPNAVLGVLVALAQRDVDLANVRKDLRDKTSRANALAQQNKRLARLQGVADQFAASERKVAQLEDRVRELSQPKPA